MPVDASLIRADGARESLAVRHVGAVAAANGDGTPGPERDRAPRDSGRTGTFRTVCLTDPDAAMATSGRNRRPEPGHRQHRGADDPPGVVPDVAVTAGEVNAGGRMPARLDAAATRTGAPIARGTADAGHACGRIFGRPEDRSIAAVIPMRAGPIRSPVPLRRFRHDAGHDIVKRPRGKVRRPGTPVTHGRLFHARSRDRGRCDLTALCSAGGRMTRSVVIGDHHPAPSRARCRRDRWSAADDRLDQRHRWRSEGCHGAAKTRPASPAPSGGARRTCPSRPSSRPRS